MGDEPEWGIRHSEKGINALAKPDKGFRCVITQARLESGEPTLGELRKALAAVYGTDFGLRNVAWLSRFTDAARQAEAYRQGRVLLAGDAAHVHSPAGGQGLNIGLQDAANLGWKLAQVAKGISPESLLDTYHAKRHPAGARLVRHTLTLTALNRGDARTLALRDMLAGMIGMDGPRKWYSAMMAGLDIRYDLGEGHPLLGRRMPDLDLEGGTGRVSALLRAGRPVRLNFGARGKIGATEGILIVDARYDGACDMGASGARAGSRAGGRADKARRIRGLVGRGRAARARAGPERMVRDHGLGVTPQKM
jgi:hypothetical protein